MKKTFTLGVIGGGFMAKAIVEGAMRGGVLLPNEIAVSDSSEERRRLFAEEGVAVFDDNALISSASKYLLLAVKPQTFSQIAPEISGGGSDAVISIMAGKTKQTIRSRMGNLPIARVMPNLPCAVGQGMTGIDAEDLDEEGRVFVFRLFSAVGKAVAVREDKLNAVTALSGSGPAYVYLFLQSLIRAGEQQGLDNITAKTLALQTLKGGLAMAEGNPDVDLQQMIDAVSSKGGTTVAALNCLAEEDFNGTISRAVAAAKRRAEELCE